MKRRFTVFVLLFLAGLAVGYGLFHLDRQTDIVSVERTQVFRVRLPDGTHKYLSFAEVERERMELRRLQRRLMEIEEERVSAWLPSEQRKPTEEKTEAAGASHAASGAKGDSGQASSKTREDSQRKLGELFARIFSKPVIEEIARSQVQREVGELAAVLGLSDEQRKILEQTLTKKKRNRMQDRQGPPSGRGPEAAEQEKTLQEIYRATFSPDQFRRYEEYQAKKAEVAGRPQTEKELFELTWRLRMTEEQEARVEETLKGHQDRLRQLSTAGTPGQDGSSVEQIEVYLQRRKALDAETTERMRPLLDDAQYKEYLRYVQEKDTETRLLEKIIEKQPGAGEGTD